MKNSVNQLDVLLNAIDAITTEKTSLLTELSLCDCYLSDIYHLLENIDFPASEYSYLMRELKDTLRERRHIKNNIKKIILSNSTDVKEIMVDILLIFIRVINSDLHSMNNVCSAV